MKFTGLILICASSCLALVLPAIGVVQFPKLNQAIHPIPTAGIPAAFPSVAQSAPGTNQSPPWTQSMPQRDFLAHSNNMPNTTFPAAILPPEPSTRTPFTVPVSATPPSTDFAPNGNKLGMGIWLLLAPASLIGLAMWTFSPNPTGQ